MAVVGGPHGVTSYGSGWRGLWCNQLWQWVERGTYGVTSYGSGGGGLWCNQLWRGGGGGGGGNGVTSYGSGWRENVVSQCLESAPPLH